MCSKHIYIAHVQIFYIVTLPRTLDSFNKSYEGPQNYFILFKRWNKRQNMEM